MPLNNPALPYGMRQIVLTPYLDNGTEGIPVALPASRTLTFTEAEEFEELEGDDKIIAVHGNGPSVDFDLEAGGISLAAWQVLTGGMLTATGTSPTSELELKKKTTQSRPYFKIQGRAISDNGGDVLQTIHKAKVTGDLEGGFENGAFMLTSCSGQGIGDANDNLWAWKQRETASALIAATPASVTMTGEGTSVTIVASTSDAVKVSVGPVDYNLTLPAGALADAAAAAAQLETSLNAVSPLVAAIGTITVTNPAGVQIVVAAARGINFTISGTAIAALTTGTSFTSVNGVPAP